MLKKLAGQTAIYGLSTIVGRFINYLLVPIQTRTLNASQFGVVTGLYAYVSFFNILLTHGMETSFFRFAEKRKNPDEAYGTALRSVTWVSIGFLILSWLFSSQISELTGIGNQPWIVRMTAAIIALDAVSAIAFAKLRKENKALRFALIKNLGIALNIILNLYFLMLCPYWHKTTGQLLPLFSGTPNPEMIFLSNLFASALSFLALFPELRKIHNPAEKGLYKEMLSYAMPMMVVGFAGMINETLDRILLIKLLPNQEDALRLTGIYGANYKLSIIITLFIQAFKYAAEPFFFALGEKGEKKTIYADIMTLFVVVCLSIFLLVGLNIEFFKHFIGEEFHEGLQVVPVLLWANIFLGIYYNLSIWYKLSDQTQKGAQIALIGAAITLVGNYLLIPQFGYFGSALATLICYFLMMVIAYIWGMKYYPIPYETGKFIQYSVLSMVIYAIVRFFQNSQAGSPMYYVYSITGLILFLSISIYRERKKFKHG
ncbi:MAG: polysaccharide biosynthesis C-terminal domain-containing protein [Bacteroidetes bacterium]|nr:polysaccharide biosynthesis C-terminal domain-containing protein [Bacteroidota bacterium]